MKSDDSVSITIKGKKHSVPVIISPKALDGAEARILAVSAHPGNADKVLVWRRMECIDEYRGPVDKFFAIEAELVDGKIVEKTGGSFYSNIPARAMTEKKHENLRVYDLKITKESPLQDVPANNRRKGLGTVMREILIADAKAKGKKGVSFPGGISHNKIFYEGRGLKTMTDSAGTLLASYAKLEDLDYSKNRQLKPWGEKAPKLYWTAGKLRNIKK